MTRKDRLERLGNILKLTPKTNGFDLEQSLIGKRCWWLVNGIQGDQPLPQTGFAHTEAEALDAAEAWFSPEIEGYKDASVV
jgi:hypothetical protein